MSSLNEPINFDPITAKQLSYMVALLDLLSHNKTEYYSLLREAGYQYSEDRDLSYLTKHEASTIISFLVKLKNSRGLRFVAKRSYDLYSEFPNDIDGDSDGFWEDAPY